MKLTRFLILLVVFSFALPAWANEDPLKLSFLNAAASGGDGAYDALNTFLSGSSDIDATDQSDVWSHAKRQFELEPKHFRSSSLRSDNADNFQRIMKDLDLEALLILDVFSKGSKMQVVVIGPSGREVADIRRDITRGNLSRDEARGVLGEIFGELVPAVREFRDAGGWSSAEEPAEEPEDEFSLIDETDETDEFGDEPSIKEKVIKERSGEYELIAPGINMSVGLLGGRRAMSFTSENGTFELSHGSPFVGFGGRIAFIFAALGSDAAIGATVLGGYAPFTTSFERRNAAGGVVVEEFKSQYARLSAELNYLKAFSDTFALNIFAGGGATSVTIAKNLDYTGHRYIAARIGAGIMYQIGPVLLDLNAGLLPIFSINNSSEGYGPIPTPAIGFEPAGGLSFGITDDISLSLRYSGEMFNAKYPEPPRTTGNPATPIGPAKSFDIVHTGLVAIGYSL